MITGAAGLLGSEFTVSLIKNGASCIAVDLNNSALKKLNLSIPKKLKKKITLFNVDLTNKSQLLQLFQELQSKKIFIDTIINNAANNPSLEKINFSSQKNLSNWNHDIELNLTSVKNIIEIFSKEMKKNKKGNIINIGSDLSIIAPNQKLYSHIKQYLKPVSYSVTKHGIVGMTKYYASLLADYNIRVNCLCPGGVYQSQDKFFLKKIKNLIPLKRMARKDEYNGAIIFLCSEESKYMTGQNLIIDGGRTII